MTVQKQGVIICIALLPRAKKMHKKMHTKSVQKNVHFFVQKRLTKHLKIGMVVAGMNRSVS